MARKRDQSDDALVGELTARVDPRRLPRHVAIIMDGNGRWARQRGLPRVAGHRAGIRAVRETMETSSELGIDVLTLYAFSRENWKRPAREVTALMQLLRDYLASERHLLKERNVRFRVIGNLADLAPAIRRQIEDAVDESAGHTGMTFVIALSYSGRSEIVEAARRLAREASSGDIDPEAVDEALFASRLETAGLPDPDLLVRTSGELRVSNFLLWQIAYAELWVSDVLWPDFRRQHLLEAILAYQQRDRRFGGVSRDSAPSPPAEGSRRHVSS